MPPESPCTAIRVSVPTLNLLIIVIPTSTHYKVNYCDDCPTTGLRLLSQLCPLVNHPTLTQGLPQSQNHLVAHTVKPLNNQHPKSHHLSSLIKSHKHKKLRNTTTQLLLVPNLQIDLVLLDNLPHFTPQSVIPSHPSKSNANTPNASTTTPNKYTNSITLFWFSSKYNTSCIRINTSSSTSTPTRIT